MELIRERGAFYALRFTNHGTQAAYHVRIELESSFLDSIEEENAKELLQKQQGREMIIGVSEHYDLFFGSQAYRENTQKQPIAGKAIYENRDNPTKSPLISIWTIS